MENPPNHCAVRSLGSQESGPNEKARKRQQFGPKQYLGGGDGDVDFVELIESGGRLLCRWANSLVAIIVFASCGRNDDDDSAPMMMMDLRAFIDRLLGRPSSGRIRNKGRLFIAESAATCRRTYAPSPYSCALSHCAVNAMIGRPSSFRLSSAG